MSGDAEILIIYQSFWATDFIFTIPLESKLLGILKVLDLDENLHIARLSDIDAKYGFFGFFASQECPCICTFHGCYLVTHCIIE